MADARRAGHGLHVVAGDVLEQALKVDILLIVAAQCHPRLLADDGDDRLVVELGVIETVEQVHGPGS